MTRVHRQARTPRQDVRPAGVNGRLSNAKFVENAKPEVIKAERQRKEELEQSREAVAASLAELG